MPPPRAMPEICPFLASVNDPESVLSYPSGLNRCQKLIDPLPVAEGHQAEYCLRARHWFCPVFTGATKRPPVPIQFETASTPAAPATLTPSTLTATPRPSGPMATPAVEDSGAGPILNGPRTRGDPSGLSGAFGTTRTRVIGAAIIVVLAAGAALAFGVRPDGLSGFGAPSSTPTPSATESETLIPTPTALPSETPTALGAELTALAQTAAAAATATPSITPTATLTLTASASPTPSATATITSTPTNTATLRACEIPPGWGRYTVAAGETYFKIATRYGTTVDALQRVNCLSNPAVLLAGQVIAVPPLPPSATPTAAPTAITPVVPTHAPQSTPTAAVQAGTPSATATL